MHNIDNHILGNNRSKVNFQNPRGEDLVHTSTLLSVPLRVLSTLVARECKSTTILTS